MHIRHRTIVSYSQLRIVINIYKPNKKTHILLFQTLTGRKTGIHVLQQVCFFKMLLLSTTLILKNSTCAIKAKSRMRKISA